MIDRRTIHGREAVSLMKGNRVTSVQAEHRLVDGHKRSVATGIFIPESRLDIVHNPLLFEGLISHTPSNKGGTANVKPGRAFIEEQKYSVKPKMYVHAEKHKH